MNLKKLDFSHQDLDELRSSDIPNDTEMINASYNNLYELDFSIFFKKIHLWFLDLSFNQISTLSFLRCFKSIGYLNITNNQIEIDDLFDIRDTVIVRIDLENNYFNELSKNDPYIIPTILSHSWIINDVFITDYQRDCYNKYENTLEFGNSVLSWRKFKGPKPVHSSVHQAGKNYILDHQISIQTGKDVLFNPPLGDTAYKTDGKSQIEKIQYLSTSFLFNFQLPDGDFSDYFGLSLGILSVLWIGGSVDSIPRLLCQAYWYNLSEDVLKMKKYELLIVLYLVCSKIQQEKRTFPMENDIWKALNAEKYVTTGKIPLIGSTPRMILAAFMSRAIAITECQVCDSFSNDLRAYFKYRKTCGLVQLDQTINSVYLELVAPFYHPKNIQYPLKNDRINCIHPLTGEWINSTIKYVKNGRIIILLNDNIISQIPSSSVFWDSRGYWREDAKKDIKMPDINFQNQTQRRRATFITASQHFSSNQENEIKDDSSIPKNNDSSNFNINEGENNDNLNDDFDIDLDHIDQFINQNSFLPKPPESVRKDHFSRRNFESSTRDSIRFSRHSSQPQYDESKLMPGWRTFRGIVEPPCAPSKRMNRMHAGLGPGQSVQDVVNVVTGNEYANGKRVKRYNVKIYNVLTKKNKFAWITDDEISRNDAKRLNQIYQRHANRRKRDATKF